MTCIRYALHDTPVGRLLLTSDGAGLTGIHMHDGDAAPDADGRHDPGWFADVVRQLDAYFEGRLRRFELPLEPVGTPFQLAVWAALREIPYGETISYGELASRVGRPGSARAVGLANGRNPLPIVVPCHRVIGANGRLVGYAGGLARKRLLLDLEARHAGVQPALPGWG
jgi:methylated-DNA-[protein]-cysteine S-methyltransferase